MSSITDGYFEEHTNDEREGGPSLTYTPLTAGSAYIVQQWRNAVDQERFARCGSLYRNFIDAGLRPMAFADERTNPHGVGCYGIAIHGLSAEGRGFLRLVLDPESGTVGPGRENLEYLSRLHYELAHTETGPGAYPENLCDGSFRTTMPLGVVRSDGWSIGLSAMRALNRVVSPKGDYALDRQNLLYLSHADAGVILPGTKSKYDVQWSTARIGDDAYPVRTGDLSVSTSRMSARVFYETFELQVAWEAGPEPRLTLSSNADGPIVTQLVLEAPPESVLELDGGRTVMLGEEEMRIEEVRSVASGGWEMRSDTPGALLWYLAPFNPYSAGNVSGAESRRPAFVVEWVGEVSFSFRVRGND